MKYIVSTALTDDLSSSGGVLVDTVVNQDGTGFKRWEIAYTLSELKELAKKGDIKAIKELVDLKGGWASLSSGQKEKVTQLILGYEVDL